MPPFATAPHTLPLTEARADTAPLTGGKAANLGELLAAGVPVPPGFVVTTTAYRETLHHNGITVTGFADPAALRAAVAAARPSADVRDDILAAYAALGGGPVAVRSSGTAEDLAGAAFAGQHDSFLNVVGEEALMEAVLACWASLWSDRVTEYRRERDVDPTGLAIAVVVQRMVPADAAGVMFTADPVTGERGHTVIDASPGLGEAVVSGAVTPDHYVVTGRTGRLRSSVPGRREVVVRPRAGGGTEEVAGDHDGTPVLSRRRIRRLTALGRRVQEHFGAPQDVEWTLVGDRFQLVQARPITALPAPPRRIGPRRRVGLTVFGELLPIRPYPMDVTAWIAVNLEGVAAFAASAGIRFPPLRDLLHERDGVAVSIDPPAPALSPSTPFRLLRNAARGEEYPPEGLRDDPALLRFLATVESELALDLTTVDYAALADRMRAALPLFNEIMRLRGRFLPRGLLAAARFLLTLTPLGLRRQGIALISGVETKTSETNRALEELAHLIRTDPALSELFRREPVDRIPDLLDRSDAGRRLRDRLADFLRRYGHRESLLLFISQPTWRDDPGIVLAILKGMAAGDAVTANGSGTAEARRAVFGHPLARWRPFRRLLERQARRAGDFVRFREDTHYYATMAMPVMRRVLREYGDRLTAAGALDSPAQVFHLRMEELHDASGGMPEPAAVRELVARRTALRERLADTPLFDRRLPTRRRSADAAVSGVGASAGTATGPVRVVTGPDGFDRLRPGEILVAPYTNPAWTPLFARAAAVVVDTGAAMSHAAIVAREYGIPAVLGAAGATRTLRDGQLVTVDGDRGAVSITTPTGTPRPLG
ncbi:pyruvate,water dikinase [Stackebrandtia albiflava]|uniref:Pyruvate,water dikinase n=1 Tax=Stackebrandtia albiflava TaxID=406432 RepID=A0A562VB01_9ACTN|nr:PEP/pyruvate-binding domain-containing protein [Stackebrandtia albiflava]TWJ15056.1 pyruvate,water dikinase [Stackebrandtia albiflava]